jgi:hypothetical protein
MGRKGCASYADPRRAAEQLDSPSISAPAQLKLPSLSQTDPVEEDRSKLRSLKSVPREVRKFDVLQGLIDGTGGTSSTTGIFGP